jgi:hypothetical protein
MDLMMVFAMAVVAAWGGVDAPAPTATALGGRAALSGAWRLDPARSEDAREKMRSQRERLGGDRDGGRPGGGMGRPGGGMGGPGGGMGGRRGGGFGGRGGGPGRGGPGDGRDPGASREAMREFMEAPPEMTITVGESEIVLLEKEGRLRRLRPDGKKVTHEVVPSESLARWEGDRLVNETWLDGDRAHLVETWALDAQTGDLLATLRVENRRFPGEPLTVRRTYVRDGAPAGGGAQAPGR